MNTTNNAAATMTFKSDRAAKVAFTKAEKAAMATSDAAQFVDESADKALPWDGTEERAVAREAFKKAIIAADVAAWAHAKCIYDAARAQGFWVRSRHFGYNATRELISNNCD